MKRIRLLFLSLALIASFTVYARPHVCPKDSIGIVKKKEVYPLMDNCKDSIQWEEVRMKNTTIQNKINSDIYALIQRLKIDSANFEAVCIKEISYEANSTITYSQNNIVSIFFKSLLIYPNFNSSTSLKTLNYSVKTGEAISFQELFKPEKRSAIDSIIIAEMKIWYKEMDQIDFDEEDISWWKEQIKNAQFSIEDTRIILYLRGNHCAYCSDEDPSVAFDYTEYKNYFNKKGVFKALLKK
ncbi:hypothetical protein [Cytophaga aurantiaca]|uniref:hypothetical protein n=1 Tax=Cytophaga aurantiaca TaxID=29530 RepID=UPI0003731C44|nr:hypothetical protein [Cytophaga aurantiaca]